VATEQDAARDRVLAARADLGEELDRFEASARAAVDIPARVRENPAKAAAVVGGVGFLALKGPQRLFGAAKRVVRGKPEPLPESMLPDEIEKTLRKLGSDGDKVRGALERDFAEYAKRSQAKRESARNLLILAAVQPLVRRGSRVVADVLFTPDAKNFGDRLAEIRARVDQRRAEASDAEVAPPPDGAGATDR
jgi:hypothetical protein